MLYETNDNKTNRKIARAILFCYLLSLSNEEKGLQGDMDIIDMMFDYFDNGMEK